MTEHRIGTQEEWQAERNTLLDEEKELTRRSDELARKRRELPWVPVEKDYRFETEQGSKSLADLFGGRSQLLVYHFMFGPPYTAGCPVCSSITDTLAPQVPHLAARDTTLLLASRAPLGKLLAYRERMGWAIDWVSSGGSDFNRDLGFLSTEEELQPFLEGEIHPTVTQMADASGTDVTVTDRPDALVYQQTMDLSGAKSSVFFSFENVDQMAVFGIAFATPNPTITVKAALPQTFLEISGKQAERLRDG